ncbi:LysR family transcriptional regulator [Oceanobacillus sp. J11TS1]|uniref:LysR family transcriptional regulator n=1 Tax=Oceanobacillus sp. J11TS1 TaxID=2807191 RepID=UPI001B13C663|nr:LysR family transcriptional regulator [Oceanobacillus sp. J11TS1]GIO22235.1 putative HTH-type transcriptional regulator YwbI [Oceanobacillus sp. J11TS1]
MELKQLTYFKEVAKHKSVTKAAEQIHISQPALSKSIKSLEEELGTPLFIRTNKMIDLTDAGNVVLEYTQEISNLVDEMKLTLSDLTNLSVGQLNIGLPPFIGSLFFPDVMKKFHESYPNIKLDITEYGGARVVKSVEEGEFELGVAVLPLDERIFNVYPIVKEEMKLIVHKDHPLASYEKVNVKDLRDEEFIFYHEDFALNQIIRNHFFTIAGFEPKILFKSMQWDLMSEMVAANLGIAILPQSICNRLFTKDIKIISFEPTIMWKLAVITKKGKYISNAGRKFIDFILNSPL